MSLLLLFRPRAAEVSDNWTLGVTRAEFDIDGQAITLNQTWSVATDPAAFEITGQDITFAQTGHITAEFDAAEFSIDGQTIDLVAPVIVSDEVQPTGGYGFVAYDPTARRRKREREELDQEERQELADRLEAVMLAEGSITKPDADLIRLRGLVAEYDSLPNKVNRAVLYAERARTEQALQLALREIQRLHDEEELAILLVLSLD